MANDRVSIRVDAEDRTKAAIASAKAGLRDYEKEIDRVRGAMSTMGNLTFGAISFASLGVGVRAIVDTSTELDRLRNTLAQGVGTENVAREMSYLSEFTNRLGLDLASIGPAYASLTAATRGTALEGEETRMAFEGIAKAAATLGMSTDQAQGALLAVQQMMSKGKVQAEELRGQLGERLPGAMQIVARAMNLTTQELDKFMELGQLISDEVIPRMSRQMSTEFSAGAERAADSMQGSVNRLSNSWLDLKRSLVEGPVGDAASSGMKNLANDLWQIKAGVDAVKASGNPFEFFSAANAKGLEQRTAAAGGIKTGKIIGVSEYIDEVIESTAAMDAARVRAETAAGETLAKFMRTYESQAEKAKRVSAEIRVMGIAAGKSEGEIAALIATATAEKSGGGGKSGIQKAADELQQLQDRINEMTMGSREAELVKFRRIGGSADQNAQADAILREIEARKDSIRIAEAEAEAFEKIDAARNDAIKAVEENIKSLREQNEEAQVAIDMANQSETAVKIKLQLMEAERAGVKGLVADWDAYVKAVEKTNKNQRLGSLLSTNPKGQYAQLATDMELLQTQFEKTGDLVEFAFGAQQAKKLSGFSTEMEKVSDYSSQFVMTFTSGFEEAIFSSKSLKDSINELLIDMAKLILRAQLLEPMFKSLMGGMGGGGSWWGAISGLFGAGGGSGAAAAVTSGAGWGAGYDASSVFATKSTGSSGVTINTTNNFAMGDMVRRAEFDGWTRQSDERTKMVVASAIDRGEMAL